MRSRFVSLCRPRRWSHTSCKEDGGDDREAKSDAAAAAFPPPPSCIEWKDLRSCEWLHLHPVEKWTTLVDLGRRIPLLLERASPDPGEQHKRITAKFALRVLHWWRPSAKGALHFGDGRRAPMSQELLDIHRRLVQELPYCVRLKLCLSFLMWVRSLRDVQDTIARLRLPYANTRRVQQSAVADVFPTRLSEWSIDPFTTVAVQIDPSLNGSAEQVPAPHAWRPDGAIENERGNTRAERNDRRKRCGASKRSELTDSVNEVIGDDSYTGERGRQRWRQRALQNPMKVLREVQGIHARPSDDDRLAEQVTRRTYRSLQQSPSTQVAGPAVLSSSHSSSWAVNDALRAAIPSPLAVDHEEDERYHHNFLRGEGCPLGQNARLMSTPIHIAVPSVADTLALTRYFVMAHTAVLSSLFVEGRTVRFTTNHSLLLEYVTFFFKELIEDGWIGASLCKEGRRPYMPLWSTMENVLVVMPPADGAAFSRYELRDAASLILEAAPCCVIIEAAPRDQQRHYSKDLMEEVERQQTVVIATETKAPWRISWVPISSSATFVSAAAAAADSAFPGASVHGTFGGFQSAVNEILRQFHAVTFLYTPSNCRFTPRQAQEWWWNGLPPGVHVVSVNSHALDLLYYFPQAPFLRKKFGNAFRYRAVRRVLVGKNVYGGREDCIRQLVHRWCCWRRLPERGLNSCMAVGDKARVLSNNHHPAVDHDKALDALKWERTIDYLANPGRVTWLALMAAKLFHV